MPEGYRSVLRFRSRRTSSRVTSDRRQICLDARSKCCWAMARLVQIAIARSGERRNPVRQIGMGAPEQIDQLLALLQGKPGEGFAADLVREVEDPGEDRTRLVGQDQPAGTAVARVGPPLDPAVFLHAIDLPHQSHRLDL